MKRRLFKYHFKFNKIHDILIKSMNEITTSMKPIMNKVKDKKKTTLRKIWLLPTYQS